MSMVESSSVSPTAKSCSTGSPSVRRPSNATPGHCDETNLNEFRDDLLTGRCEPLDVPGDVLTVSSASVKGPPRCQSRDHPAVGDSLREHVPDLPCGPIVATAAERPEMPRGGHSNVGRLH
jgi:hypothetical protein